MTAPALTERIAHDLDRMGEAIARNDVEAIETTVVRVSAMLCELKRELLPKQHLEPPDFSAITVAAKRCSFLLRRARLALTVLRNLHELCSAEQSYGARR
jgi:hypothetical protein